MHIRSDRESDLSATVTVAGGWWIAIASLFAPVLVALVGVLLYAGAVHSAPLKVSLDGEVSSAGSSLDTTGNFDPGNAVMGYWHVDPTAADGDSSTSRRESP